MTEKFEASFESLRTYECPDWFRDVKFGIWSHWGPQRVPMEGDTRVMIQGFTEDKTAWNASEYTNCLAVEF